MGYEIRWRPKALDELRKFPKHISQRIINKIDAAKENPEHFLEKLIDDPGYKVRAGDYRVIVDILEEERVIAVRIVGHRKNIYKRYL
ncbi:type II toxin-antitoxin system RelE/ParE family toxin [Candidatus Woesearchaeota archaeon]|nr:type II toxin-antitoxin system RelE/ParE family toxin [Candidatus Woesearchaeota archaeon]